MAKFIPSLETIFLSYPGLSKSEHDFLKYCNTHMDDNYEIYYRPYLNGDKPHIIILYKNWGAWIIEIFEGSLVELTSMLNYDEKKEESEVYYDNTTPAYLSPIEKVHKYKENIFNIHIEELLEKKIYDIRFFDMIQCTVWCTNIEKFEIKNILNNIDNKIITYYLKSVKILDKTILESGKIGDILNRTSNTFPSLFFLDNIYQNIKRLLNPSLHLMESGFHIAFNDQQTQILKNEKKEIRVNGVFGAGKTLTLVAKAVDIYIKLKKDFKAPKILILSYNLTLKNLILDKLFQIRENFIIQDFIITNYHQFIKSELNNLDIRIKLGGKYYVNNIEEHLENNYYSNEFIFKDHKHKILPYDAILIDEVQDYHYSWLNIIKKYFLKENGYYILFGDAKQNVYGNSLENKEIKTNIIGKPITLKQCYRADSKIRDLAFEFQKHYYKDKYPLDEFTDTSQYINLFGDSLKEGTVEYQYIEDPGNLITEIEIAITKVRARIRTYFKDISPNDIIVLGSSKKFLQGFDFAYRNIFHENTLSLFETLELVNRIEINTIKKGEYEWYDSLYKLIIRCLNNFYNTLNFHYTIIKNEMSLLLPLMINYKKNPSLFQNSIEVYCKRHSFDFNNILVYLDRYGDLIPDFSLSKNNLMLKDQISRNKKIHFKMNCGMLKVSTIQSFKGLEGRVVFLIIDKEINEIGFHEILYTGITRAKENLVILNIGNKKAHDILNPLVQKINSQNTLPSNNNL